MKYTMLSDIFSFVNFQFYRVSEITIFAEILNIVAKFRKDSIFKAEILAKLSQKY